MSSTLQKNITAIGIIMTILFFANNSLSMGLPDQHTINELRKCYLQAQQEMLTLEFMGKAISDGTLTEDQTNEMRAKLLVYIEKGFDFINNPSNQESLAYFQHYIDKILPDKHVQIINDYIAIAQLDLTTEEKMDLIYPNQISDCDNYGNIGNSLILLATQLFSFGVIMALTIFLVPFSVIFVTMGLFAEVLGITFIALSYLCAIIF